MLVVFAALGALAGCQRMDDPKSLVGRLETADAKEQADLVAALARLKDKALPEVAAAARSDNAKLRVAAAQVLGRMRSESALKALEPLLSDKDVAVRREALLALKRLVPVRKKLAVQLLEEKLKDPDFDCLQIAATTLAETNYPQANALVRRLITSRPTVPGIFMAKRLFVRDGTGRELLLKALASPDENVRATAVEQVKLLGPAFVRPLVDAVAEAPNDELKAALAALRDHLIKQTETGDPKVRLEAIQALGNIADPRSIAQLLRLLKTDEKPRSAAALTLGTTDTQDPAVVAALSKLLNAEDTTEQTRLDMAIALAQLGNEKGLQFLLGQLQTSEEEKKTLAKTGKATKKPEVSRFLTRVLPTLIAFLGLIGVIVSVSVHSHILNRRGDDAGPLIWLKLLAILSVAMMSGGFGYLLLGRSVLVIVGGFIGIIVGVWLYSHAEEQAERTGERRGGLKTAGVVMAALAGGLTVLGFGYQLTRGQGIGAVGKPAGGTAAVDRSATRAKAQKALSEVGGKHRAALLDMFRTAPGGAWVTPEALAAKDPLRVWAVIKTLGELRERRAAPVMITLLTARGAGEAAWRFPAYLRWTAAMALGQIGDKEALAALKQALASKDLENETVRYYVTWAIREIEAGRERA